jgi:hypothetical protein
MGLVELKPPTIITFVESITSLDANRAMHSLTHKTVCSITSHKRVYED